MLTNGARKSIRVGATTMKYHLLERQFAHRMRCLSPRLLRLMSSRRRHNLVGLAYRPTWVASASRYLRDLTARAAFATCRYLCHVDRKRASRQPGSIISVLQGNPCHCYFPFLTGEGVSAPASASFKAHDHAVRIIATALRESGQFPGRFFVCAIAASEMATVIKSARWRGCEAITQQRPQCKV